MSSKKINHRQNIIYGVYRGEEFVCAGTLDEVCDFLKVKRRSIQHMAAPAYAKRIANKPNRLNVEQNLKQELTGIFIASISNV